MPCIQAQSRRASRGARAMRTQASPARVSIRPLGEDRWIAMSLRLEATLAQLPAADGSADPDSTPSVSS